MLPPAAGRELIIEHLTQTNDLILELLFQTLWVKYDDMRLIYKALKSRGSLRGRGDAGMLHKR